jgi:hypothetical protein
MHIHILYLNFCFSKIAPIFNQHLSKARHTIFQTNCYIIRQIQTHLNFNFFTVLSLGFLN